jgi:hypothetical protein
MGRSLVVVLLAFVFASGASALPRPLPVTPAMAAKLLGIPVGHFNVLTSSGYGCYLEVYGQVSCRTRSGLYGVTHPAKCELWVTAYNNNMKRLYVKHHHIKGCK